MSQDANQVKNNEPQLGRSLVTDIMEGMEGRTLREKMEELERREHRVANIQETADLLADRFTQAGFRVKDRHNYAGRVEFNARLEWRVAASQCELTLRVRVGVTSSWMRQDSFVSNRFALAVWEVLGQWNPDTRTARQPGFPPDARDLKGCPPIRCEQAILTIDDVPILIERQE